MTQGLRVEIEVRLRPALCTECLAALVQSSYMDVVMEIRAMERDSRFMRERSICTRCGQDGRMVICMADHKSSP